MAVHASVRILVSEVYHKRPSASDCAHNVWVDECRPSRRPDLQHTHSTPHPLINQH